MHENVKAARAEGGESFMAEVKAAREVRNDEAAFSKYTPAARALAGMSAGGIAASGEGCGKGAGQEGGPRRGGPRSAETLVHWHTCKKCRGRFSCLVGTKSTKHSTTYATDGSRMGPCDCGGLCNGFKKGHVCSGC